MIFFQGSEWKAARGLKTEFLFSGARSRLWIQGRSLYNIPLSKSFDVFLNMFHFTVKARKREKKSHLTHVRYSFSPTTDETDHVIFNSFLLSFLSLCFALR